MIDVNNDSLSVSENQNQEPDKRLTFWNTQGKIIPGKLYEFFESLNIGLYKSENAVGENEYPTIVWVTGNLVSEINEFDLSQTARNYIDAVAEEHQVLPVLDSLHKNVRFFGKRNQYMLKELKLNFIRDTRSSSYLFFKNGIVEITADAIRLKSYENMDGCVWKKNIVDHEFTPLSYEELSANFDFFHFLQDITKVDDTEASENRFNSLFSVIGYLSHRYKDPTLTKAIILMDASPSESGNGGTGKTLVCIAIGYVRTMSTLDGKSFDQDRWFKYSSVRLGTNLILFDDVGKDFDFEKIYSLITTGLEVQRIGKDDIHFSYEDSPKVVLTTNYAIQGDGSSFKRRIYEFEISNTFNADYQPSDKYGKRFFEDWDEIEWNRFYNLITYAIQYYLQKGELVESTPINIKLSKLKSQTNDDFVEFAKANIILGVRYDKNGLFQTFKASYPDYASLTQKTFTFWLKKWGSFLGAKTEESHSDSFRYIVFTEISNT